MPGQTYDIAALGRAAIPTIVADPDFRKSGHIAGESNGIYYAVIDPNKLQLFIWGRKEDEDYIEKAKTLGAALFTNGPQMGPAGGQDGKPYVRDAALTGGSLGAAGGYTIGMGLVGAALIFGGPVGWAVIGTALLTAGGGLYGAESFAEAAGEVFHPFNRVVGAKNGIDQPGLSIGGTAWFGRKSPKFIDYKIAMGEAEVGYDEASGGLIIMLLDHVPQTQNLGFVDFFKASHKIATWGLVPFYFTNPALKPPTSGGGEEYALKRNDFGSTGLTMPGESAELDGVIVALGVDENVSLVRTVPRMLQSIGVRDAVATDGGQAAMMGAGDRAFFVSSFLQRGVRNKIGQLGLYCTDH